MFSLHEHLWPGGIPRTPERHAARSKEAARHGPSPATRTSASWPVRPVSSPYTIGAGEGSDLRPRYAVNLMREAYVPMVGGTTPQATRAPPPPSGAGVSE